MPNFPFCEEKEVKRWSNYTGTLRDLRVPLYCTIDTPTELGANPPPAMARHGAALRAIIDHCFKSPGATLRTMGARWSLSNIIKPGDVVIDPANLNGVSKIGQHWLTKEYRERCAQHGFVPIFAQGGTHISRINRRLAQTKLALQTSGAGDGHRIAGCIATGTHGSAINIGAVHDTVRALHVVVAPNDSVLLQPSLSPCFGPEVATWLEQSTGIRCRHVEDDALFSAAQVSLGSLGFVHGVILETVPLYALEGSILRRRFDDADVWKTIGDLETQRLHPDRKERPYHFEVVLNPYPSPGRDGAFVKLLWKVSAEGVPAESPLPAQPDASSDVMGLISTLTESIDGSVSTWALRLLLADQLERRYKAGPLKAKVPGMVFGPTTLPPGRGTSTEVIVSQAHARASVEALYEVLGAEASQGSHLLGAVALRFVPEGNALLGPNLNGMNCYIELPSIRNNEVHEIYRLWWDALERKGIPFTCHWGQIHGLTPARLERYFGDRVARWKQARKELLPTPEARRVFASPLLSEVGLD
jgi:hypothetical protein